MFCADSHNPYVWKYLLLTVSNQISTKYILDNANLQ